MKFRDIPQFPRAHYEITVDWSRLERHLSDSKRNGLEIVLEPDYQRGHVWSEAQQIAFVEYGLMGGESSMTITTNCVGWMASFEGPYEVVDGLQRITAVRKFVRNEIQAFGHYYCEFEDRLRGTVHFNWKVCNLATRSEVLQLYLLMNSGGVVHSPEEIARVRALLEEEASEKR